MKRKIALLFALALLCGMCAAMARADEPLYRSYAYTPDGRPFYMQTPYVPVSIVGQYLYTQDGEQIDGLNAPSDLCLKDDGTLFIADRGNNRIVQISMDGVLLKVYGTDVLKGPEHSRRNASRPGGRNTPDDP